MSDKRFTTETGVRVTFATEVGAAAEAGVTHVVWLDTDPERLGRTEAVEVGRVIDGRFQCAWFSAVAMSPPVLHAIANLLAEVAGGDDD